MLNYKELKEKYKDNFIDEETFNKLSVEKREVLLKGIERRLEIIAEINEQQKEFIEKMKDEGKWKNEIKKRDI